MIDIIAVVSDFHPRESLAGLVEGLSAQLQAAGIDHRIQPPEHLSTGGPVRFLLILTGGTERTALQAVAALDAADGNAQAPVVLLAHPSHNSFPACLEILARLGHDGRRGEIVFLDGAPEGGRRLQQVATAAQARGQLAGSRLGCVGAPSDWLVASLPSPADVASTWGVELVDVDLAEVLDAMGGVPATESTPLVEDLVGRALQVVEPAEADLRQAAAVLVALRGVIARHRLQACTVRCFDLVTRLRTTGCYALSQLNDEGVMAGCEGDVPAAVTMMWLHAVTGEIPFMANPQQLAVATGRLWLSHCTIGRSWLEDYRVRSHFESQLGVGIEGRLAPQPVTLARIGGAKLDEVFLTEGRIIGGGDSPDRCRTQLELEMEGDLGDLLRRPLGNHHVLIRGRWAEHLRTYRRLF